MPTPQELYNLYLQNNPAGERIIELVSISHPDISQTYHITPTPEAVSVTLETGQTVIPLPKNVTIEKSSSKDDLDEQFSFSFSDPEGIIKAESKKIPLDSTSPVMIEFRSFMASDTGAPAEGPYFLEAVSMTPNTSGVVTIRAQSPSLVVNRTGELYTYERFPMLRGFL